MKYRMTVACMLLWLLTAPASPALADLVREEFPEPEAPETIPLLLAGLVFVILVSGVSFTLLRRMARKRNRRDAAPDPSANADPDKHARPASET